MNSQKTDPLILLEAGDHFDLLLSKLQALSTDPVLRPYDAWILCIPGQKKNWEKKLPAPFKTVPIKEVAHLADLAEQVEKTTVAFLPAKAPYFNPTWPVEGFSHQLIYPWIPPRPLPERSQGYLGLPPCGWMAPSRLLGKLGERTGFPSLLDLEGLQDKTGRLHYASTPVSPAGASPQGVADPSITRVSKVLAVVPHFNCVQWLEQCLDSLVTQTRPPDGIVVADDASGESPLEIVSKFPSVTLLRAAENVGPYRLVQSVIDGTGYEAYMFQDADDWSAADRLELLLADAETTGAELVSAQELMYLKEKIYLNPYPRDVNHAFSLGFGYSLLHPSSLVSKAFNRRLGGYSSALRFGGDLEFQSRAVWAGKVRNLGRYGYFRRIRENSLITSPTTGIGSPARRQVDQKTRELYLENTRRASEKQPFRLEPLAPAEPVAFQHLAGPALRPIRS